MQEPFEIVKTQLGAVSIKCNLFNGEILHNPLGPKDEPHRLYIEQTGFMRRLIDEDMTPLVIYDVGLGAAANSLAAYDSFMELKNFGMVTRPLTILSFENDLSMLEFALSKASDLDFISPHVEIVTQLLKDGEVKSKDGHFYWKLIKGDFTETLFEQTMTAELIFFDAYSPKVNALMWEPAIFKKLSDLAISDSVFVTYSISTAFRTELLLNGWFVGKGVSSGPKLETTIASKLLANLKEPLDDRWVQRCMRSHTVTQNKAELEVAMGAHPQFAP